MNDNLKEIQSKQEIKELVDAFYDKVNKDKLLSPVFNDFAGVNWEKHLPIMYNFWSTVLLGELTYKGNPSQAYPVANRKSTFRPLAATFHGNHR